MTSTPSRLAPLHLAVALDGAGWHPAAWREPHSRPSELFSASYWTELVTTAERGLLDFVTIEDSLSVPPTHSNPSTTRLIGYVLGSMRISWPPAWHRSRATSA
ncbi:hypothetical protein GCM10020255_095060 [Rhodococcus baikonurensis]